MKCKICENGKLQYFRDCVAVHSILGNKIENKCTYHLSGENWIECDNCMSNSKDNEELREIYLKLDIE